MLKIKNNKLPCKKENEAMVQTYIDSYSGIIPKVEINDYLIDCIQKLLNDYRINERIILQLVGLISTMPQYSDKSPDVVYKILINEIKTDLEKASN